MPGNSIYYYTVFYDENVDNITVTAKDHNSGEELPDSVVSVGDPLGPIQGASSKTLVYSFPVTFDNAQPADVDIVVERNGQVLASKRVYLVKVDVTDPPGTAAFKPSNSGARDTGTHNPDHPAMTKWGLGTSQPDRAIKVVASGIPPADPGLKWAQKVTLTGPGNNLGVDKIRVGFIQFITPTLWSGSYQPDNLGVPGKLVSDLQGKTFLDMAPDKFTAANPTASTYNNGPWYDRRGTATFFGATPGDTTKTIKSEDTPVLGVPSTFQYSTIAALAAPGAFRLLTSIQLDLAFHLDVAAQTTDTANGADQLFYQERHSEWRFVGTGNVSGFNPEAPAKSFTWTGINAGTTVTVPWKYDGILAEEVNRPIFNQQLLIASYH